MSGLELILIRHPRPAGGDGRCYGRLDLPLEEPASAAANRILPTLTASIAPSALETIPCFTSPRQRCWQLAAALHPSPQPDDRLAEMNFGEWEGCLWDDIPRAEIDTWAENPYGYPPPGGEAPTMVLARLMNWLSDIEQQGLKRVMVVTHAGPIRLLLCHYRNLPLSDWPHLPVGYESINQLRISPFCTHEHTN